MKKSNIGYIVAALVPIATALVGALSVKSSPTITNNGYTYAVTSKKVDDRTQIGFQRLHTGVGPYTPNQPPRSVGVIIDNSGNYIQLIMDYDGSPSCSIDGTVRAAPNTCTEDQIGEARSMLEQTVRSLQLQ